MSEAFGPVLSVLELPYEKMKNGDYLNDVVIPFVNDKSKIFGSLSCTLIVPPATVKSEPVQKAISSLRYGAVCVNQVSFYGYNAIIYGGVWEVNALGSTAQSDISQIGNHYCIPHLEKSVVYVPDLITAPPINNKMIMSAVVVDSICCLSRQNGIYVPHNDNASRSCRFNSSAFCLSRHSMLHFRPTVQHLYPAKGIIMKDL